MLHSLNNHPKWTFNFKTTAKFTCEHVIIVLQKVLHGTMRLGWKLYRTILHFVAMFCRPTHPTAADCTCTYILLWPNMGVNQQKWACTHPPGMEGFTPAIACEHTVLICADLYYSDCGVWRCCVRPGCWHWLCCVHFVLRWAVSAGHICTVKISALRKTCW